MNSDQKKVVVGAISGGLSMVVLVAVFYLVLPLPGGVTTVFERIIFALQWNVVALLPLFFFLE